MSDPVQVTYERWWVVSESQNSYGGNPQCKAEHASVKAAVQDIGKRINRDCPPKEVRIYRSDREAGCEASR